MPRKARVLVPGCPHHIVQRGHNRRAVFVEEADYLYYLENLREWKLELGLKFYAWCLMTNHVHLIAEPCGDPATISVLMRRVNGRQTALVNKLEKRSGTLWEGRFKASPIQAETYLLACMRYVELNPVKAGLVGAVDEYRWSSFPERAESPGGGMLDINRCYKSLGLTPRVRMESYRSYLAESGRAEELKIIQRGLQRNQLTGNPGFVDEIEARIGVRIEQRGRGRPRIDRNRCVPY